MPVSLSMGAISVRSEQNDAAKMRKVFTETGKYAGAYLGGFIGGTLMSAAAAYSGVGVTYAPYAGYLGYTTFSISGANVGEYLFGYSFDKLYNLYTINQLVHYYEYNVNPQLQMQYNIYPYNIY